MARTSAHSSESARTISDKSGETIDKMADRVESAVTSMAERGREVGDNVQQVAGNLKSAVDVSLKEQPMATLAVAAAIGFVLGALWKS
jgi:ElaB/YqjD/DUF883 family membrane-anchored ribosome-binding protein